MTQTQQVQERAKEPVSRCLIRHLVVPDVYWDAPWPSLHNQVDLLAIDRAGSGDVHVVQIKRKAADALKAIPRLMHVPAQYRWIAFLKETADRRAQAALLSHPSLYPAQGPGRVGIIEVVRLGGDTLGANIKLAAERFPGSLDEEVQRFVAACKPTISFA